MLHCYKNRDKRNEKSSKKLLHFDKHAKKLSILDNLLVFERISVYGVKDL